MFLVIFASVLVAYVVTSLYFLFHPQHLHKERTAANQATYRRYAHISHRGGAAEAYENTLAGYKRAVAQCGTQMLELDVRRTNDDVVVVCHDMNLQRTCGVDLRVDELKFSDLPVMSKKLGIESEPGKYFEGNGDDDRKIPTLDSIFEAFPDVGINIDIKNCDARLVHGVDALVRRHKREAITVWGTFSHETTELCRAANARVGLLFSFKRVLHILVLFYTGLLPFVDVSETHFEIPMISSFKAASLGELGLTKQPRNAIRTAVAMTLDAILTRPLLFRHLNARGIQVYLWVLNTEGEFARAFECGATGVMTDYPERLSRFLKKNPQYMQQ